MSLPERRITAFVDAILKNRRPPRFTVDGDEAEVLRTAVSLRTAAPGADLPDPRFVEALGSRLRRQVQLGQSSDAVSRRRVLGLASTALAGMAVGAVAGRTLLSPEPVALPQELVPTNGTWVPVARAADLPEGALVAFSAGAVHGFLHRRQGGIEAVSGICTHLGCSLRPSPAGDRLDCPCHRTSFSPEGSVVAHQLPSAPAPLPRLRVRITDGVVEVLTARL